MAGSRLRRQERASRRRPSTRAQLDLCGGRKLGRGVNLEKEKQVPGLPSLPNSGRAGWREGPRGNSQRCARHGLRTSGAHRRTAASALSLPKAQGRLGPRLSPSGLPKAQSPKAPSGLSVSGDAVPLPHPLSHRCFSVRAWAGTSVELTPLS